MHIDKKLYEEDLEIGLSMVSLPEGYYLQTVVEGVQNENPIWLFRFGKNKKMELGGEHFSFTVDRRTKKILGLMWMDRKFSKERTLLAIEESEKKARDFMNNVEPGLLNNLIHKFTEPHDEIITVDGKKVIVTGMKYKNDVKDGTYAWAIVGADGSIIAFEQEIIWESTRPQLDPKDRNTERWIYDDYLAANNSL